jgi:hypothetical protein
MAQSKNNHRSRVARSQDKVSTKSREDRSTVVGGTAPTSPIWMSHPAVQSAGTALIQAGIDLAAKEKEIQQLDAQLQTANSKVTSLRITWDEKFNVYAGHVELRARKPEDISALGLVWLDEATYALAPPLGLTARYDRNAGLIRALVERPPGERKCRVEISPNPIVLPAPGVPGSYKEVKGDGARRTLAGYPPGGYWLRAAIVDAEAMSSYTAPVFVMVS